ncbi:hypothetical protein BDA99DRAFT_529180, partial [Phascolomyces articulosus]
WGLKRNLPSVIRTPHITVSNLDTNEHQTPWESGSSQVLFIRRWKENFPNSSKRPIARHEQKEYNIDTMTPAEFKQFIKQAKKKAPEFHNQLKSKELVQDQVFEFLGATFHSSSSQELPQGGSHSRIVGPTYSDPQSQVVEMGYPVQGRILGPVEGGYAVGVGGVVAFLPKRMALNIKRTGNRSVRTFYVQYAGFDKEGRPRVTLRLHQPLSATSLVNSTSDDQKSSSQQQQKQQQRQDNNHHLFRTMRAEDMFLTQSSGHDDQELDPNPNHAALMEMMARLVSDKNKN